MLVTEPGEEHWGCLFQCSSAALEPCSGHDGKLLETQAHTWAIHAFAPDAVGHFYVPTSSRKSEAVHSNICALTEGCSHTHTHTHTHTHDPEAPPAHALKSVCLCWAAAAKFFAGSCVPCADQSNFPQLCQLCAGKGTDKCACSHHEPYFGYSGAFKWVGPPSPLLSDVGETEEQGVDGACPRPPEVSWWNLGFWRLPRHILVPNYPTEESSVCVGLSSTQNLVSGPGRPLGSIDTGLSTQPGQRSGPAPSPSLAALCLSISIPGTRTASPHLLLSPVPEGTFPFNMPARDITNIWNLSKTDQVSRLSRVFILCAVLF